MNNLTLAAKLIALSIVLTASLSMCGSSIDDRSQSHWPECATGDGNISNAHVIVALDKSQLEIGDIVGGFVGSNCVGQFMYTGANAALTLWRSDAQLEDKRGFSQGDSISIRIFGERVAFVESDKSMIAFEDSVIVVSQIALSDFADREALTDALAEIALLNASLSSSETLVASLEQQRDAARAERDQLISRIDSIRSIVR